MRIKDWTAYIWDEQWINCWLIFNRGDRVHGKGKTKRLRQKVGKEKIREINSKNPMANPFMGEPFLTLFPKLRGCQS